MAANHNVVDLQVGYREFDRRRRGIGIALGTCLRNNIAHIFNHKQIPRLALGDQLRQHTRIGAGNKQGVGILSFLREFAEKLPVIAKFRSPKFVNAFYKWFHLNLQGMLRGRFSTSEIAGMATQ